MDGRLRACALRSANLLNKADLARDVGIAPSTANQWLSMLEASGQAVLLEPWFSNRTKSIVKSPKLYIADTGLLCALLNIRSEEALRQSPAAGAVWETFVFAQLRDRERRAGRSSSLFFWRDRTREVDFVVDAGKEQADVSLQYVPEAARVFGATVQSAVRPFAYPVRVGIEDERPFEKRLDDVAQRVVHYPVPVGRRADEAARRLVDGEGAVRPRPVTPLQQFVP